MEIKKTWEEYNKEEKETLLNHWFYYYGGMLMTPKDLEDFQSLSKTKQDEVFNHIVTNYIFNSTIQSNLLLMFMREGKVDEFLKHSIDPSKLSEENKAAFNDIRNMIAKEVSTTFLSPEPPVPLKLQVEVSEAPKLYR